MSGLAATYNLDGRPAERELLDAMLSCIAERGAWSGFATDGPVAIGLRAGSRAHDPKADPVWDVSRDVCLSFAGRLDNRSELEVHLESRGVAPRARSDSEIVLEVYLRRGSDFLQSILGDFALVIWDRRRRVLLCARDPLGVRPLFYRTGGNRFLCGTALRQLLLEKGRDPSVNEGMVGEYLACAVSHQEETLYHNVYRVPPAHVVEVSPARVRKWRYWDVDPRREVRYARDEEYADHLREVLREAVRCRLAGAGRAGVLLSGGLDSSAVACVAEAVRREDQPGSPPVETFTQVFPGLACDESPWSRRVVEGRDLVAHMLPAEPPLGGAWYADQARRHLDFPGYPDDGSTRALLGAARERGIDVVLTGYGGDEWLSGSRWHYADLLGRLKLSDLLRRAGCDEALAAVPGSRGASILKYGLWPLLPLRLRRRLRAFLGRRVVPGWIDADFARRIDLEGRLRREILKGPYRSFSEAELRSTLEDGGLSHGLELEDRLAAQVGVEQRHPFHDRRIVELAFAIPEEQRCRPGMPKWILREAMAALLPEEIRRRPGKADFSGVFTGALREVEGADAFAALAAAGRGWIDGIAVTRMYEEMVGRRGRSPGRPAPAGWPLWMIYGIDVWLRAIGGGRAHALHQGGRERVLSAAAP